jgi:hypothetical protein
MEKLKADFAELKKGYAKLQKLENGSSGSDAYYNEREIFVEALRKFLYQDFTELNKENFLWLCDRISTFRPVAPFSFLVSISNRKSKKKVK